MRILHYSDKAANNFIELYNQCDLLITTGDLTIFDLLPLENLQNKKPAFGVYGNHDAGTYMDQLGITNLHLKTIEFSGLVWGGFQGCPKYKESPLMYTEEQAQQFADTFPPVDILLLHAGPQDMLDDPSDPPHTGSPSLRRYVLEKRPRFVILGHQYSDAEMTVGSTTLYRTYGARLIDLPI